MQYIEAFEALVLGEDIAGYVAQWVPNVEACSRGVREHVEHVVLGQRRVPVGGEGAIGLPARLPLSLELLWGVLLFVWIHGSIRTLGCDFSVL